MDEITLLKRRIERERNARRQAERILEDKALELYRVNESLEETVNRRTLQLRQSEIKYRSIIENMQLGLLEVDNDEVIIRAYPLFCQMMGYEEEELRGKIASQVFQISEDQEDMQAKIAERKSGLSSVYELAIHTKSGELKYLLVSGGPILNEHGEVTGSLGIHYDITYQKELQQELEEALYKAEAAQRAQKAFVTSVSHEIRTPLNVIIGMSELLEDSKLSGTQKEYLHTLKKSADILMGLISDVLDIAKIDSGEILVNPVSFPLCELVKSVRDMFSVKLEFEPVEIRLSCNAIPENQVEADEKLIRQVLINLVGNAAKFTHQGYIDIGLNLVDQGDRYEASFAVSDTGIGIKENDLDKLFKQFVQVHDLKDKKRDYGGTGLGLAISHRIVEALGGNIHVSSEYGKGTMFQFTIPLMKTNMPLDVKPSQIKSKELPAVSHPVLIVEDNPMNQQYVLTLMKKWGIPTHLAENGKEAVDMVAAGKYSLVLMDIQMPIMNGYDATRAIRQMGIDSSSLPIVALTASTLKSDHQRAFDMGIDDFLAKPFKPDQLQNLLLSYLPLHKKDLPSNPLDESMLEEIYQGDAEYRSSMFQIFLETVPAEFENLERSLRESDFDTVHQIAHKIKPNFDLVGLPRLREKMQSIELACKSRDQENVVANLVSEVKRELQLSLPHIKRLI